MFLVASVAFAQHRRRTVNRYAGTEAAVGFDNETNGSIDQAAFDEAMDQFLEAETPETGLGPVFNSDSCGSCHVNAGAVGSGSQILEMRAGRTETLKQYNYKGHNYGRRDQNEHRHPYNLGGAFIPATVTMSGGEQIVDRSLVNQRSVCVDAASHVGAEYNVTASRLSLPIFGDGYIEAISDEDILAVAAAQAQTGGRIHGQAIMVPLLEADGLTGVGRFGWKDQHVSLLSFSADAYFNEMGFTNFLLTNEVVAEDCGYSPPEPNDVEGDTEMFAAFMRALKAPPRGLIGVDEVLGEQIFGSIGCASCHVATWHTVPAGTPILGGTLIVGEAIGDKIIHPYSDFLLHDIGTGDGIVQNGGEETANKMRTMPLWGIGIRSQFIHDAQSGSVEDAIDRHKGEAWDSTLRFRRLAPGDKAALLKFVGSL